MKTVFHLHDLHHGHFLFQVVTLVEKGGPIYQLNAGATWKPAKKGRELLAGP